MLKRSLVLKDRTFREILSASPQGDRYTLQIVRVAFSNTHQLAHALHSVVFYDSSPVILK